MCFNCGCFNPNDDMGSPKNITNKTFKELADAKSVSFDEIRQQVLEYLEQGSDNPEFEGIFIEAAKAWGQSVEEAKSNAKKLLVQELKS